MTTAKARGKLAPAGTATFHLPGLGRGVSMHIASNQSAIARVSGMGRFTCPICGVGFSKPWAWAKRVDTVYCGMGCASQARRIEVEVTCRVCSATKIVNPSTAARWRTCSRECYRQWCVVSQAHKRKPDGYEARQRLRNEIRAAGKCASCGRKHGPWIVRGLGEDCDASTATLLCWNCYVVDLTSAPVWTEAEDATIRSNYAGGMAMLELLPGRTLAAIYTRACFLGVTQPHAAP